MVTFPNSHNRKAWEVGIVSTVSQFQFLIAFGLNILSRQLREIIINFLFQIGLKIHGFLC